MGLNLMSLSLMGLNIAGPLAGLLKKFSNSSQLVKMSQFSEGERVVERRGSQFHEKVCQTWHHSFEQCVPFFG